MTREEILSTVKEFPAYLMDAIEHNGYKDKGFDVIQAQKDIEALTIMIAEFENNSKIKAELESLEKYCADNDKVDIQLGVQNALSIVNKYIVDTK